MLVEAPSILITDDDRAFRETLQDVFQPRGFRTLLAQGGEQALRIVRTETVHLVLMDLYMPKRTGLDVIRRVKQYRDVLPCILISADLDDAVREEAREARVFSVLSKPISCAEITDVVGRAMRQTYDWPARN